MLSIAPLNVQPMHALRVYDRRYIIFSLAVRTFGQRRHKLTLILVNEALELRKDDDGATKLKR